MSVGAGIVRTLGYFPQTDWIDMVMVDCDDGVIVLILIDQLIDVSWTCSASGGQDILTTRANLKMELV